MPSTASAVQADRADEPDQLPLRFFAIVGGMHSAPPERALWRELLDLALGKAKTLSAPDGRSVSASVAWAVGAAVYFRANSRGVVEGFSHDMLAADCRIDPRTARSALKVLGFLRIVAFKAGPRRRQRGPRPRALHMNLGGLDWPAVRRRAKLEQTEQADLLSRNSGHHARQLDGNSGHHARQSDGIGGHHARQLDGNSGHHARQSDGIGGHHARQLDGNSGHHARLQRANPERAPDLAVAAAGTSVGREGPAPDHRAEQQQQETKTKKSATTEPPASIGDDERRGRRADGLLAVIAVRSRDLGEAFDERHDRRLLEAGELDVDALQERADALTRQLKARAAGENLPDPAGPPSDCTACGADLRRTTFDVGQGCPRCGSSDFATPAGLSRRQPPPAD